MHREILGLAYGDKRLCDHKNRIPNDNRRANLRICTQAQNQFNTVARGASGIKGVCWDKQHKKWRAQIRVAGRKRLLGVFKSLDEARELYDLASQMLHGEFAGHLEFK